MIGDNEIAKRIGAYVVVRNDGSGLWPFAVYKEVESVNGGSGEMRYIGQFRDIDAVEKYARGTRA